MKTRTVISIIIVATCIRTSLAQSQGSSSAQSNAEMMDRWVQSETVLAAKGDADAEDELGIFYYLGTGVPQDYTRAARWFRKAAKQGNAGAQGILGDLYLEGEGVPQDYSQAYFWLDLAAAQRSSLVQSPTPNASQALQILSESTRTKATKALVADRDRAASHLTPAELLRVQQSAGKWLQSHEDH